MQCYQCPPPQPHCPADGLPTYCSIHKKTQLHSNLEFQGQRKRVIKPSDKTQKRLLYSHGHSVPRRLGEPSCQCKLNITYYNESSSFKLSRRTYYNDRHLVISVHVQDKGMYSTETYSKQYCMRICCIGRP